MGRENYDLSLEHVTLEVSLEPQGEKMEWRVVIDGFGVCRRV